MLDAEERALVSGLQRMAFTSSAVDGRNNTTTATAIANNDNNSSSSSSRKKRKKKKKNKKKKTIMGMGYCDRGEQKQGDAHNPLSRAFKPKPMSAGITKFVARACQALKDEVNRYFIWEATTMLGTHAMSQILSKVEMIAECGTDRSTIFWDLLQGRLGKEVVDDLVVKARKRGLLVNMVHPAPSSLKRSKEEKEEDEYSKRFKLQVQELSLRLKDAITIS